MYKDVGKRILAVMLCICMLAGMGAVSNLSARADVGVNPEADADVAAEGEDVANPEAVDAEEDGLEPLAALTPGGIAPTLKAELLKNVNAGRYNGEPYEIPKENLKVTVLADGSQVADDAYTVWYGTDPQGQNQTTDAPVNAGSYYFWVVDDRTRQSVATHFLDIYRVRLNSFDLEWTKAGGFPVQDKDTLTVEEAKNLIVADNLIVGNDRPMGNRELVLDTDYEIKAVAPIGNGSFSKPGSMIQVTLGGLGNYEAEVNIELPVLYKEFTQTVTALDTIPYDEDGSREELNDVTAALELAVDGKEIAGNADYVVSYYRDEESANNDINAIRNTANMRAVGTYYYRVTAASGQSKGVVGSFRVVRSLYRNSHFSFSLDQEVFPYTGLPHEPKVTVMETYTDENGNQTIRQLELGKDYTVEYKDNIEVGIRKAVAIVRGINNYDSGYVGEMCEFTIEKIDLSNTSKVTVEIPECEYSWKAEEPKIRVFYQTEADSERTEITGDLDFTFVRSELAKVGETTVTITPKPGKEKNYLNAKRVERFTINPRSLNHEAISVTVDSKDYDGAGYEPVPTVMDDGVELVKGRDYEYTPVEVVGAGKGKIVLKGIGNYTDTREVEFWINAATLDETNTRITLVNNVYEYTGSVLIPSRDVTVEYNKSKDPSKEEWITLVQGAGNDYIIEPAGSNTEAGTTAKIRIVGQNNYSGSITKEYTISQRDINSDKIDVYLEGEPFYYTGEEYRPSVSVRFSSIDDITLVENTDYTISYEATSTVDKVGKITITGIGNFKGTRVIEYHITPQDLSKGLEVRIRENDQDTVGVPVGDKIFPYNGTPVEPFVDYATIVTYTLSNGRTIELGTNDYKVKYENNIDIGTAIIVITGGDSGNYEGEGRIEFKIRGSLGDAKRVKVSFKEQSYTGSSIVQEDNMQSLIESITFEYNSNRREELIFGKDYEVVAVPGADYVNAGRAPVIIRSLPGGNYTGECRAYVTIKPRDLGSEGVQIDVAPQVYRGYAFTPAEIKDTVKVTYTNGSHTEEVAPEKFEVLFGSDTDAVNATGEEGTFITVKAVVGDDNNFGGANTKVKLIIEPLNIQDALNELQLQAEYLMVADPVKLTKDDLTLSLKDEFKQAYIDTYKQITGNDQDAAVKQLIKLREDIKTASAISKDAAAENPDPSIKELEYTSIGENTVYLYGTGNYTGILSKAFTIKGDLAGGAAGPNPVAYVSYRHRGQEKNYYANGTDILEAYYIASGANVEPNIEVWYVGEKLTVGKDYTLTYEGTRHDLTTGGNEPIIRVTGVGLLSGSFEVSYKIVPCDFNDTDYVRRYIRIDGLDNVVYTGADQSAELAGRVVVRNIVQGGNAEIDNQNIAVAITNATNGHQSSNSCADNNYANCPTVKIDGKGDRYTGTLVRYFDILGIDLNTGYTIRVEGLDGGNNPVPFTDKYPFTGEVVAPKVAVYAEPNASNEADKNGERLLKEGEDYNLIYWNSAKKEVTPRHAGAYIIAIVGKNNYSGNVEQPFSITPKSIHDAGVYISVEEVPVYAGGDVVKPVVRIIDTHRQDHGAPVNVSLYAALASTKQDSYYRLVDQAENPSNYDYSMIVPAVLDSFNNTDAYAASNKQGIAQIMAANDYQGSCYTNPYRIGQYNLENGITVEGLDGVDQTYTGQPIEPQVTVKLGDKVIQPENAEYIVQYANNVDAGTADVTIVGAGKNLTGSYSTTFSIAKRNFAQVTVEVPNTCPLNSDGVAEPKPVIKDNGAVLVEGEDYELSYRNNTNVGQTGTVTIKGINNYTDDIIMRDFTVVTGFDLSEASVTVEDQAYTGQPIEPKVVLQLSDRTLIEGTDYTLSYENNTEPGTATIIITGIGAYGGTKIVNFEILAKPEGGNITITPPGATYMYTGSPIQPIGAGFVTSGSTVLTEGKDYEVIYENNVNVGTATVTVNGKGSYTGSQTFTFQIIGRPMALCQVSGVGDVTYDGNNATPQVNVTDNGRKLTVNRDYSLLYLNNEKPGEARVLINGQGNYSGCKVVTFNILAPGVSNVTAKAESSTRVTLSWNGANAVTGYEIWSQSNQRLARTSETSYTISGLNPGTTYQYRVRSYTIRSGQVFYSNFVPVSVSTN